MINELKQDLKNRYVDHRALLSNLCVVDEKNRKSPIYQDPYYFPFYYHLGKYIKPKIILEMGMGVGFISSCFLKSCKSVESYIGFQQKTDEYYSPRLAIKNIKYNYDNEIKYIISDVNNKNFTDNLNKLNLIFFNENIDYNKIRYQMDLLWNYLEPNGYIIINYYNNDDTMQAVKDFSKIKNRDFDEYQTRYGTAIIQK